MNSFVRTLQDTLIDSNIIIEHSLIEIKGVYTALDKLDKDYIDGIVLSLKKAKSAIGKAETSLAQVKTNSEQNTKTLQALKQTIDQFKAFKNEVNDILPLIPEHSKSLEVVLEKVNQALSKVNTQEQSLKQYQKRVESTIDGVKSSLELKITEAKNAAEEIAAEALSKSERALEQKISEAKSAAEETAAESLSKSERALEQKISEAKGAAEKSAVEALGKSEKAFEQKIIKASSLIENKMSDTIEELIKISTVEYRKKIVLAYLIGGLGLFISIITVVLSILKVI